MRVSELFSKTYREVPKEADSISATLLLRAGMIEKLAAGIYSFLPLGWRVHQKIAQIIREEMDALGGQEILMPALQPKEIWTESDRWDKIDPPLFKFKDRHQREMALGSTHEEVVTLLAKTRIQSYKDLPKMVYQIQNKFRNELRSTGGLLRVREFIMKDAYSFHRDQKDFQDFYQKIIKGYQQIFSRFDLKTVLLEAESGSIGGSISHEFLVLSETGEDKIYSCPQGHYSAKVEKVKNNQCPNCRQAMMIKRGIENGHIFDLGTLYSKKLKAYFIDQKDQEKPFYMGCYGIGLGRLLATIVETHFDQNGIIWPWSVAPFQIYLVDLNQNSQAQKIYQELSKNKFEVLYDYRDLSPGIKFADADLLGIPLRIVISPKTIVKKGVEVKKRNQKEAEIVATESLIKSLRKISGQTI